VILTTSSPLPSKTTGAHGVGVGIGVSVGAGVFVGSGVDVGAGVSVGPDVAGAASVTPISGVDAASAAAAGVGVAGRDGDITAAMVPSPQHATSAITVPINIFVSVLRLRGVCVGVCIYPLSQLVGDSQKVHGVQQCPNFGHLRVDPLRLPSVMIALLTY
jgi:hypothetical protein